MKYLGIDLGGTHIAVGVVDDVDGILYKDSCPTGADREYKLIMEDMVSLCKKVIADSTVDIDEIKGLGVGLPGIETPAGMSYAKNLYWDGVPLAGDLAKALDLPVYIDNDAHAAALAEVGFGSLIGCKDAIMLTLGTGVGGAMIINDKIYSGSIHAGGELGHFTFMYNGHDCSCGRKGCYEQYASASALIRMGKYAANDCPTSSLHTINGSLDNITAKNVVDAAREGDAAARGALDYYIDCLAQGVISFINIYNPEKVSIGGGLSQAGDIIFDDLKRIVKEQAFNQLHLATEVVPAMLKNDAGILGAAMVAQQGLRA